MKENGGKVKWISFLTKKDQQIDNKEEKDKTAFHHLAIYQYFSMSERLQQYVFLPWASCDGHTMTL